MEVIFTVSAESINQVDLWAKEVENAGGKIISRPEAFGKGYYSLFLRTLMDTGLMIFIWKGFETGIILL